MQLPPKMSCEGCCVSCDFSFQDVSSCVFECLTNNRGWPNLLWNSCASTTYDLYCHTDDSLGNEGNEGSIDAFLKTRHPSRPNVAKKWSHGHTSFLILMVSLPAAPLLNLDSLSNSPCLFTIRNDELLRCHGYRGCVSTFVSLL